MPDQISSDTVFVLCPTLSGNALFTSTIHRALLSLNQMHFIMCQFNVPPLYLYIFKY